MKIFFIGDISGEPGRAILKSYLRQNRDKYDLVIANGENASGGKGLSPKTADEIFYSGVDVITLGDHAWDRKEIFEIVDHPGILRPLNYPDGVPGKGWTEIQGVTVVSLQGRVFMPPLDSPFHAVGKFIEGRGSRKIIVDFHAEATSEKVAMGWFLDGRTSAVLGTHTHIPTADAHILPGKTAYITDVGMTGSFDSVIGVRKELILKYFLTGLPVKYEIAPNMPKLCGVELEINAAGEAEGIHQVIYSE